MTALVRYSEPNNGVITMSKEDEEEEMNEAIERLRASKQKHDGEAVANGNRAGRYWAEKEAEFYELARVSRIKKMMRTSMTL